MVREVIRTPAFAAWFDGIKDSRTRRRLERRLLRLADGLFGDVAPVGGGVFELREHFGPGYRIYYVERQGALVLLLCGGDKASQPRDIARAKTMTEELEP